MIPVTRVHGPGPAEQMSIRLESDRVCGSGRFSNVYRAIVTTASSTVLAVAVKNVWEEKNSPPIVGTHPEVRILAQLDHPNVVRLLYHYTKEIEQQRVFCLVLNFMPDDMAKLRERGVRFDPLDACLYAYQLLSAVAHLADRQVLHLDIKPANLLVDHSAGILQLADFGNAQKAEGKELEQTNVYQVTRYYRPPEVLFGSKFFSTAIDTWSAACCIAEFVTGHVLFKGRSAADQTKLLIGVFGYPTDEDVKAMRVTRPRTSRHAPRGLDKYTGGDIPPELMDLLRLVFVYNPAKRAAARDCLAMGFFARLKKPHHPTRGNGTPLPELLLVGLEGGGGTKKTTDEQKRQGEEAEEDSDSEEAD